MVRMKVAGGCGENGRSCFFVDAGRPGAGFLVDCGVSQDGGFPRLTREEISRVSAVFLTSAAPERAGALSWLATQGFTGQVVAPACTLLQLPQTPARPVPLERLCEGHRYGSLGCVSFTYGRSGGSAGGVWYRFSLEGKSLLFSGGYTEDTLLYACDPIRDTRADAAVLDCAYGYRTVSFEEDCEALVSAVRGLRQAHRMLLFPVPPAGRGIELLYLLHTAFPAWRFGCDRHFAEQLRRMPAQADWFKRTVRLPARAAGLYNPPTGCTTRLADAVFVSDPTLTQPDAREMAETVLRGGGFAVLTDTPAPDTPAATLLAEGKAVQLLYPTHPDMVRCGRLSRLNRFVRVIPAMTPDIDSEREIVV